MAASIRFVREADARALSELYGYYVRETPITLEYEAPDAQEMTRRIRAGGKAYPWLVCELDGAIAGYAYAAAYHERAAYRWCVKLSVYTARGMEGKRLGTALYNGVIRLLCEQGYCRAYATVTLPNPRSEALHRSQRFVRFGVTESTAYKLGSWLDVAHYERRLRDGGGAPPVIRTLDAIGADKIETIFAQCAALIQV